MKRITDGQSEEGQKMLTWTSLNVAKKAAKFVLFKSDPQSFLMELVVDVAYHYIG